MIISDLLGLGLAVVFAIVAITISALVRLRKRRATTLLTAANDGQMTANKIVEGGCTSLPPYLWLPKWRPTKEEAAVNLSWWLALRRLLRKTRRGGYTAS